MKPSGGIVQEILGGLRGCPCGLASIGPPRGEGEVNQASVLQPLGAARRDCSSDGVRRGFRLFPSSLCGGVDQKKSSSADWFLHSEVPVLSLFGGGS